MTTFDRRELLRRAAITATATAGIVTSLAGCSQNSGGGGAIAAGKVTLPTYVPSDVTTPDLPSIAPTGTCGYTSYPDKSFSTVTGKVLTSGKPVTAMMPISQAPTLSRSRNKVLQLAEAHLGGQVDFVQVTESDYLQRFNTTIAGGDLPDVMFFQPIASYAALLEKKFTDLTPYLAGDKIKEYPNLANIPSAIWQASAVGDKIYGLPQPRNGMSGLGLHHKEMYDEVGGYPTTADEYMTFLKELTRPQDQRWGMVADQGSSYNLAQFLQIFGVPFQWQASADGSLTAAVETDGYRAALEFATKLYAAGIYHPNSNGPGQQMAALFDNGQVATSGTTVTGLLGAVKTQSAVNRTFRPRALTAFSHDGSSDPVIHMDFVSKLFTVVTKASDDRVREILRLANFAAAPIGSEEYELLRFGKEGVTFDYEEGRTPIIHPAHDHNGGPWGSITSGPMAFFDAEFPETVTARYEGTKDLSPYLVEDPTAGHYSPTQTKVGATLAQKLTDTCTGIIAGRQPLSDFDKAIAEWKSGGGDKIKSEFEEAMGQK